MGSIGSPPSLSKPPQSPATSASVAKSTAKIAVTTIDSIVPEVMRAIAKNDSATPFKADADTRADLERAVAEYIKLKGIGDIPPGTMIVVLLLVAYGTKIPLLLQLREANKKAQEQERQIDELKDEIAELKNQNSKLINNIKTTDEETI